jgi:voltage-gated potassium channel
MVPSSDVSRSARQFWIALLFLALLVIFGATIYVNIESRVSGARWTVIDAVYMAVITIATIGFMEVHPLSQFGRAFTTGFAITGIILAAFAVRSAASLLLGEQLTHEVQRRRRMRAVNAMRDHYIVCGYGRMGKEAVFQLRRRGLQVVVIENELAALDRLREEGLPYVEGNAAEDEELRSAGIERAKVLIAACATDEDNVFVVLSARLLNPNLYIVARASLEAAVDKLMRAGANHVLSPYVVGGRSLAAAAAEPGVLDFIEMVLHRADMDVEIASITIPPKSPLVGKAISDPALTQEGGAMILAVMSGQKQLFTNPRSDRTLVDGDRIIAMGSRAQIETLKKTAGA